MGAIGPMSSGPPSIRQEAMHHHSIRQALELAESLDEDMSNYSVIRELKVQLRALLKDQEASK